MGLYIPGMEMPKCQDGIMLCVFPDGKVRCMDMETYAITTKRAVPVPDHGDLIDKDALIEAMARMVPLAIESPEEIAMVDGLSAGYEAVKAAPTIIDAEGEET